MASTNSSNSTQPLAEAAEDEDPVVQEFDIYITPELGVDRKIYLFQHATRERDHPYSAEHGNAPVEMRLKPQTGFVEMDVPINTQQQYHKTKAKKWGEALHQTSGEGGFGLASGLMNAQGPRARGRGRPAAEAADESLFVDDSTHKMVVQTLGGQVITPENGTPKYMIGTFNGKKIHLTELSGIVQMRPQFHNIDAMALAEKTLKQKQNQAASGIGASGVGVSRAGEPRAVTMTSKPTNDNEDTSASDSKAILERAQQESWIKLAFMDEEDDSTWAIYSRAMFLENTDDGHVTQLVSDINNEQYMDKISARRESAKRNDKKKSMGQTEDAVSTQQSDPVSISESDSEVDDSDDDDEDDDAGLDEEAAAHGAASSKGKGREGDAMEID